jgi:hypothetical protein
VRRFGGNLRSLAVAFVVGVFVSAIGMHYLNGCGHLFQTGLYLLLAYLLPHQFAAYTYLPLVVNSLFHGAVFTAMIWVGNILAARGLQGSPIAKRGLIFGILVLYCMLQFLLFPIRECAI